MIALMNKEQEKNKSNILKLLHSIDFPFYVPDKDDFEILPGGSRCVAIRISDFVVRFPLNQEVWNSQQRESFVCQMLKKNLPDPFKNKITDVKIAKGFVYHKMIKGRLFDKSVVLSEFQEDNLAYDLAAFLSALHCVPTAEMTEIDNMIPPKTEDWDFTNPSGKDGSIIKQLLQENAINPDDFQTDKFDRVPVVCHNDLSGSNILIDDRQDKPLQAVIDFGAAGLMPRSNDFVPFYKISRSFAHKVMRHYNQLSLHQINPRETDCKALWFIGTVLKNSRKESLFAKLMIENFKNG